MLSDVDHIVHLDIGIDELKDQLKDMLAAYEQHKEELAMKIQVVDDMKRDIDQHYHWIADMEKERDERVAEHNNVGEYAI